MTCRAEPWAPPPHERPDALDLHRHATLLKGNDARPTWFEAAVPLDCADVSGQSRAPRFRVFPDFIRVELGSDNGGSVRLEHQ